MKSDDLFDAIGNIDGDMIQNAQIPPENKAFYRKKAWISAIAAMFVLSVTLLGLGFLGSQKEIPKVPTTTDSGVAQTSATESPATTPQIPTTSDPVTTEINYLAYALAAALYPEDVLDPNNDSFSSDYNEWLENTTLKNQAYYDLGVNIEGFLHRSIGEFLSTENGENAVFSPLNVYMAFAMLAEITDSNSRKQILDVLGCDSIETLRQEASALWLANYCDDGSVTSILANSVWLSDQYSYKQDTMQKLADIYYASSFSGEMGSDEYNEALQNWLNAQTGGILEDSVKDTEMDPSTIMALATTIYFKGCWFDDFSAEETESATFHTPTGDVSCDFMNQRIQESCYFGEKFIAVPKKLGMSFQSTMWLILPNEGVTPEELLKDEEAMAFLTDAQQKKTTEEVIVNLSVPKFDVSSGFDLCDGMKNLGITDVFDSTLSDYSPMTSDCDCIYLGSAEQSVRVAIDENGCTAAAFTLELNYPTTLPPREIDFTLDRPFLFAITSDVGLPLFVGIVNQPQ